MKAHIQTCSVRRLGVLAVLLLLAGGLLLTSMFLCPVQNTALAQSPQQSYDLSWHTIDGGGHTWSSGGTYILGGTMGQSDTRILGGGMYVLRGGFWRGGALAEVLFKVYLPLLVRNY